MVDQVGRVACGRQVTIRCAHPSDAAALHALTVSSKAHWGYPDDFLAAFASGLDLSPEYIARHDVRVAVSEDHIVGFAALVGDGATRVLDHLWVTRSWIGRGVGTLLFLDACQRASAGGASRLELEAEPHAVGFYTRGVVASFATPARWR